MKSHKIWMLSDSVYKTESGFKDALNLYIKNKNFNRSRIKYKVYELKEEGTIDNLIDEMERDFKLKQLLGEIPKEEVELRENIKDLYDTIMELYKSSNNLKMMEASSLEYAVYGLKSVNTEPSKFIRVLKERKKPIFKLSNSKEYFKKILKVHNFRSLSSEIYDDSYQENFRQAKLELKKEKTTKDEQ